MAKSTVRPAPGTEKRGGYTGGQPAAQVRPPAPIPSGTIKPALPPAQPSKPT
jgi:hypothetical protein